MHGDCYQQPCVVAGIRCGHVCGRSSCSHSLEALQHHFHPSTRTGLTGLRGPTACLHVWPAWAPCVLPMSTQPETEPCSSTSSPTAACAGQAIQHYQQGLACGMLSSAPLHGCTCQCQSWAQASCRREHGACIVERVGHTSVLRHTRDAEGSSCVPSGT